MNKEFVETVNETETEKTKMGNGRKLAVKESTFTLDEGLHKGTITDAFWYKTVEGKDRVMLVFQLEDGTVFKNTVDGDWIDDYPFSVVISQANIDEVRGFIGLKVKFDVRNKKGDGIIFSNIRKIRLDE